VTGGFQAFWLLINIYHINKLLSAVTQDAAHDVGPADHQHNSMWDYLKKYKNNHITPSLPQTTRSNASLDKQIWMKGPSSLNPLNWHCRRFRLGHHLFQHPLSPYDEKSAQDLAKLLLRMKEQASTATTNRHPLFMAPFTPEELINEKTASRQITRAIWHHYPNATSW